VSDERTDYREPGPSPVGWQAIRERPVYWTIHLLVALGFLIFSAVGASLFIVGPAQR
jgi:hypothetical protein